MCYVSVLTHHLHFLQRRLFPGLSPSDHSAMTSFAGQRLILDIDASVFVLLSPFCSDAEVYGTEGIQTLSASLPFGLLSFLPNNAGPIIFAVKRGISVHFEICLR